MSPRNSILTVCYSLVVMRAGLFSVGVGAYHAVYNEDPGQVPCEQVLVPPRERWLYKTENFTLGRYLSMVGKFAWDMYGPQLRNNPDYFKVRPGQQGPLPLAHTIPEKAEEVMQNENEKLWYFYGRHVGRQHAKAILARVQDPDTGDLVRDPTQTLAVLMPAYHGRIRKISTLFDRGDPDLLHKQALDLEGLLQVGDELVTHTTPKDDSGRVPPTIWSTTATPRPPTRTPKVYTAVRKVFTAIPTPEPDFVPFFEGTAYKMNEFQAEEATRPGVLEDDRMRPHPLFVDGYEPSEDDAGFQNGGGDGAHDEDDFISSLIRYVDPDNRTAPDNVSLNLDPSHPDHPKNHRQQHHQVGTDEQGNPVEVTRDAVDGRQRQGGEAGVDNELPKQTSPSVDTADINFTRPTEPPDGGTSPRSEPQDMRFKTAKEKMNNLIAVHKERWRNHQQRGRSIRNH